MAMIKKINTLSLLLLINFNNIISMQPNDLTNNDFELENLQQNSYFLNLPEELIHDIFQQLIDTNKLDSIIEKIKNAKDIFELYSLNLTNYKNVPMVFKKELMEHLKNIRQTSRQLIHYVQSFINRPCINKLIRYYIRKLQDVRYAFKEKEQEFIREIKNQYSNYCKYRLNEALEHILTLYIDVNEDALKDATKLIIAGADINLRDSNGATVLSWAAFYGNKEIVELLLNYGADVNLINKDGDTALMLAEKSGHKDIVNLIESTINQ